MPTGPGRNAAIRQPAAFQVILDRSSANLQVQLQARSNVALPQRQPASIGLLTSTGLVSPTF